MIRTDNINNTTLKVVLFIGVGCLFALAVFNNLGDDKHELMKAMERHMVKAGGLGAPKGKDGEVAEAVEAVKQILESREGTKYKSIDILSYKTQTVAGINYFAKVKAITEDGKEELMHLRIYRDLKKQYELTAYEKDKTLDEEIVHFQ